MIKIAKVEVKEASRVYGDYVEKRAFELNLNPAAILGSVAGGYAATNVYRNKKEEAAEAEREQRRIENDSYAQVENVLNDLQIVFTPINVIYKVNDQVFEIIQVKEMTPHMRSAFVQKDHDYFKGILMNKINMEVQLAEKAFAQRLLNSQGFGSQTNDTMYTSQQEKLSTFEEDTIDGLIKEAQEELSDVSLAISPTFDDLRPFSQSEFFFNRNELEKVAGIFSIFQRDPVEDINMRRFSREVNVGFLPDRVVFTWNGQVVEQLSLLKMNETGYEAFRKRDKNFFLNLFHDHTKEIQDELHDEVHSEEEKTAEEQPSEDIEEEVADESEETESFDEEEISKMEEWYAFYLENPNLDALSEEYDLDSEDERDFDKYLQDRLYDEEKLASEEEETDEEDYEDETTPIERENVNIFRDGDIHPMVYSFILERKYGAGWMDLEAEALIKQIEIDYDLTDGLTDNPYNKILLLHTLASDDHALFMSPLTFEKFVRGMNSKDILFQQYQGNVSLEEMMFAFEIAKAFDGDEFYFGIQDKVHEYVSEELFNDGVRVVSEHVYDESNPAEKDFFETVNGLLLRKWRELDSQGVTDDTILSHLENETHLINELTEEILAFYTDEIDMENPYDSVNDIIQGRGLLHDTPASDRRTSIVNMVFENVFVHLTTVVSLMYRQNELNALMDKLSKEGVL